MPAFIRTKGDEKRWSKAKKAAAKSKGKKEKGFQDQDWALTNYIYHKMHKAEMLERLYEILSKQEDDDDDLKHDVQVYDDPSDEELGDAGYRTIDPDEETEGDDADKWLQAQGSDVAEQQVPENQGQGQPIQQPDAPQRKSAYSEWQPRKDYSAKEQEAIKGLMDQGYSHREAERLAGAHKGPSNFQDALHGTIKPSEMSPKMREELKGLAGHWLDRADRHGKINADPTKNPQKFASGQMMQAHENATKDYNSAYNELLNSDQIKNLKGHERHKAIQAWKQDWKGKNPGYGEGLGSVSESQKHFKEAPEARAKDVHEQMMHILTGGQADPSSAMSMQEAAQHVGGTKGEGEGEGYTASTIQDPSAKFAQQNPEYIKQMQAKQPAAPAKPAADPKQMMTIIRRRANPEQMDRFNRIQAARKTLIKKPEET